MGQEAAAQGPNPTTIRIHCMIVSLNTDRDSTRHVPSALGEEIVLAIDMDHTIFEHTLPLVLHTSNLRGLVLVTHN